MALRALANARPRFWERIHGGVLLLAGCLVWLLAGTWAAADETAPATTTAPIDRLIADLGANEFLVRQLATQRLANLGTEAIPRLEAARTSDDAEVRQRAKYVLEIVQRQQHRIQLDRLRRGDPMAEHDLPGWETYVAATGDSPAARELFADILSQEWELVESVLAEPTLADAILRERAVRLRRAVGGRPNDLTAMLGAVLLVHCDARTTLHYNALEQFLTLMRASPRTTAKPDDDPMRRLMSAALVRAHDPPTTYAFLELGQRQSIAAVLQLADRTLNPNPANGILAQDPSLLRAALATVAQFGTTDQVAWLEPHFEDPRRCISERDATQVRDLALATAIHLTKDDPALYGLSPFTDVSMIYSQRKITFPDEATREKAFQTWKTRQAARLADRPLDGSANRPPDAPANGPADGSK